MKRMKAGIAGLVAVVVVALPAMDLRAREGAVRGDPVLQRFPSAAPAGTPACSGGLVYDDGSFESLHGGIVTGTPEGPPVFGTIMRFDPPAGATRLEQVCLCWARAGSDMTIVHDIVLFAVDPVLGGPGAELWRGSFAAIGVPETPTIFSYDVSDQNVAVPSAGFYLGATWDPLEEDFRYCNDEDGQISRPKFFTIDDGASWTSFLFLLPGPFGSLGIRADVSDGPGPSGPCVEDATTLCLADGRFQVRADWRTEQGTTGDGRAEKLTSDTGYFWFFSPDNVEMVVKVLDACGPPFDRFWVFAGGLTNVEVTMTVVDTEANQTRVYTNPQRTPFRPLQDTQAFDTCP